jgi:ABC-type nitrate/sulfonate/bicarbonate transport system substrate-binding protein
LSDWLRAGGINPQRDVRIVVVPPPQMFRNLAAGNIDGYCVGEPWTSLAIQGAVGWCAVVSRDLHPGHPEKVLMVSQQFAATRADEHLALVAALTEAAALCDDPEFRPGLSRLLARREYLNLPVGVIAAGLIGQFNLGHGAFCDATSLVTFHAMGANDPQPAKAEWLIDGFRRQGLIAPSVSVPSSLSRELFRSDLFHQACHRHLPHASLEPTLN